MISELVIAVRNSKTFKMARAQAHNRSSGLNFEKGGVKIHLKP